MGEWGGVPREHNAEMLPSATPNVRPVSTKPVAARQKHAEILLLVWRLPCVEMLAIHKTSPAFPPVHKFTPRALKPGRPWNLAIRHRAPPVPLDRVEPEAAAAEEAVVKSAVVGAVLAQAAAAEVEAEPAAVVAEAEPAVVEVGAEPAAVVAEAQVARAAAVVALATSNPPTPPAMTASPPNACHPVKPVPVAKLALPY
ncbi:MAG: hypothetical protein BWY17_00943 [Deltaproteobacteria bacterium ADurb.Bin207]|nr:MAG: hypothetical protein BWY17_00943 [Deltaproteobacteria bacterium ADurb.Bin207]